MNILVCVKPVPDPEKYNLLTIDPQTKRLKREGIPSIVNPADKCALEAALQIREKTKGRVIVVSMAPTFSIEKIRECLAMGADEAYLISDRAFGGADTWATSYTLAKAIEAVGLAYDLILCGNESADGATSHVPTQLGEWLGIPHVASIEKLEIQEDSAEASKKLGSGSIRYGVKLPALFSVLRGINTPRLVSAMGIVSARKKPLNVLTKDDIPLDDARIGLDGSPTKAGELISPDMSRKAEPLEGDADEVAGKILSQLQRSGITISQ